MKRGIAAFALGLVALTFGCATPAPLRVMSFNIRTSTIDDGENAWPRRRDVLIETIRSANCDVLGLQEVMAEQLAAVLAALPEYDYYGVGRDDGASGGEFAPILFRKDRLELVSAGHFWLSATPDRPGSVGWDAALPRIATWARLTFRSNPFREFYVYNTHFDHVGEAARRESARLLRRSIEIIGGRPVLVLGDFNAAPGSDPYRELTGSRGNLAELRDAFVELGLAPRSADAGTTAPASDAEAAAATAMPLGTFHGFSGVPGERIDWVLHNRQWQTLNAAVIATALQGVWPSDHFPVTATLRLREPGEPTD